MIFSHIQSVGVPDHLESTTRSKVTFHTLKIFEPPLSRGGAAPSWRGHNCLVNPNWSGLFEHRKSRVHFSSTDFFGSTFGARKLSVLELGRTGVRELGHVLMGMRQLPPEPAQHAAPCQGHALPSAVPPLVYWAAAWAAQRVLPEGLEISIFPLPGRPPLARTTA